MSKSLDPKELKELIEKTLKKYNLYSEAAVELLMGTCAQESALGKYRHQIRGPAHGIMQLEETTFNWLKQKYGDRYPDIKSWGFEQLIDSDVMSIVMARLKYLSIPKPLPPAGDLVEQAFYWNTYYNCNPNYGTDEEYVIAWHKYASKSFMA